MKKGAAVAVKALMSEATKAINSSHVKCWECGASNSEAAIFCVSCNHLQAPRAVDAFVLFNFAPAFEIDEAALEQAYLSLQQQVHPDRYANASAKEQRFATAHTLALNAAYDVLKSPLGRAEYLLEQQGLIVNRDGRDSVKPSQMLLMESLEAREKLEHAKDVASLRVMQQEVKDEKKLCLAALKDAFDKKNYQQAAQSTIRLKYLQKLQQEVKEKKRNF